MMTLDEQATRLQKQAEQAIRSRLGSMRNDNLAREIVKETFGDNWDARAMYAIGYGYIVSVGQYDAS